VNGEKPQRSDAIALFEMVLCLTIISIHVYANAVHAWIAGTDHIMDALYLLRRTVVLSMPGFIFTAALKYGMSRSKRGYGAYLFARVRRVYVPYLIWCLIFYLFFIDHDYFAWSWRDFGGYILRGDLVAHFYFILVIMQFYILAPLIKRLCARTPAQITLPAAALVTFIVLHLAARYPNALMWDRTFVYYIVFWVLGTYAGQHFEKFCAFLRRRTLVFIAAALVISAAHGFAVARLHFYGTGFIFAEQLRALTMAAQILGLFAICLHVNLGRLRGFVNTLHAASFYAYLAHPIAIVYATEFTYLYGRFAKRYAVLWLWATIPVFVGAVAYTLGKSGLKKLFSRRKSQPQA
jgi:membrane-bound acyltransferase YfiQ involved in biofilm formation